MDATRILQEGATPLPTGDVVFPAADGVLDTEARVVCPWCGERLEIGLDPGSGSVQEYSEDCEVCCRPIQIAVRYAPDGSAFVDATREGE